MPTPSGEQVPITVVGSSTFGLYPKISLEKTYNMFMSDNWLVNYAGYQYVSTSQFTGKGRGLFKSSRGNFMVAVIGSGVYKINESLAPIFVGNIDTQSGAVYMDENLHQQICIVDGLKAYIYYYGTGAGAQTITAQSLSGGLVPDYVNYHNTFFLFGSNANSTDPSKWYAYQNATNTTISQNSVQALQTKPDNAIAVHRIPGRGNNVLAIGRTVAEVWTQTGGSANYTRVSSYNIDVGALSIGTIAASEEFVVWLAQNENNSPIIVMTNGGSTQQLSTDGINNLLQDLVHPEDSSAFFYRQDGHLFYQITFYNPQDNLTLFYDFNTQKFFHASDENLNYFPARQAAYYNGKTYFISLNDNKLYEMSTNYVTYNYEGQSNEFLITESAGSKIISETGAYLVSQESLSATDFRKEEIPRIRICNTVRFPNSATFRVNLFTFWLEQGVNDYFLQDICNGQLITQDDLYDIVTEDGINLLDEEGSCMAQNNRPRVDMSYSKNGNQTFSNIVGHELNPMAHYKNQIRWFRMGLCNEFTVQLRFWGFNRVVANNGVLEVY